MNNKLEDLIRNSGYRFTSQRRAVIEIILENEDKHLSSQEVFELVSARYPYIGMSTVYRTLPILEKLGFILAVNFEDGCTRYEINKKPDQHSHHHLICMTCGNIYEVEDDLLDEIEEKIYQSKHFKIVNHRVKFYGYCETCLKNYTTK